MEESLKYIGFDVGTQSLKATVIDENLKVLLEASVHYDSELPEFRTHNGVHIKDNNLVVTAPTLMWVKALDLVLEKLKVASLDFSTVVCISGDGQQHGSIYWKKRAQDVLGNLKPDRFLHEQLQGCFALRDSPVWMDSSTTKQCRDLEEHIGGAMKLAEITGSAAYERFTGNQIKKIYETRPEIYRNTERISLVSSFIGSIFLGKYAPIDHSDASGMNLLDIHTRDWSDRCLEICAPDLREKLGTPVPAFTKLGQVSSYFVSRYGFSPSCCVTAFTGDNPASLAGLKLQPGDVIVSLGTSDTIFLIADDPKPSVKGHVMCSPTNPKGYFAMLCFKNGSLTRERIRDDSAEGSWNLFSELLDSIPRGNFGNIGMYYDTQEIIPFVIGDFRFNKLNEKVTRFSKEVEVRAVIEGQFLAKRIYAENLGFNIGKESRILATGGAAKNISILQVLADVFNAPVYTMEATNSASIGAAYLAKFGSEGGTGDYHNFVKHAPEMKLTVSPNADAAQVYNPMVTRYRKLEESTLSSK